MFKNKTFKCNSGTKNIATLTEDTEISHTKQKQSILQETQNQRMQTSDS